MAQEIEITFRVLPEQATALLKFLTRVGFDAVAEALDDDGEKIRALGKASERLRVALRRVVEPGDGE
jgi:hypothetical protein